MARAIRKGSTFAVAERQFGELGLCKQVMWAQEARRRNTRDKVQQLFEVDEACERWEAEESQTRGNW
eukprot:12897829-Prorocentrum_lima.AAC.1